MRLPAPAPAPAPVLSSVSVARSAEADVRTLILLPTLWPVESAVKGIVLHVVQALMLLPSSSLPPPAGLAAKAAVAGLGIVAWQGGDGDPSTPAVGKGVPDTG